eukprot:UC4_evm1s638
MATLIGLSIRVQLLRSVSSRFKVDVSITPGSHASEDAVNKQLADKERVAAALENAHLIDVPITKEDIFHALRHKPFVIRLRDQEVHKLVDAMDINGVGNISYQDFHQFYDSYIVGERRKGLKEHVASDKRPQKIAGYDRLKHLGGQDTVKLYEDPDPLGVDVKALPEGVRIDEP